MQSIQLGAIDYAILAIYLAFVLGIGWALRGQVRNSEDFLTRSSLGWTAACSAGISNA